MYYRTIGKKQRYCLQVEMTALQVSCIQYQGDISHTGDVFHLINLLCTLHTPNSTKLTQSMCMGILNSNQEGRILLRP